jgi:hypothetical protein
MHPPDMTPYFQFPQSPEKSQYFRALAPRRLRGSFAAWRGVAFIGIAIGIIIAGGTAIMTTMTKTKASPVSTTALKLFE